MAKVTIAYDTPEEASIGSQAIQACGPDVFDTLVTTYLIEHIEDFRSQLLKTIIVAASIDPAVKTALDSLIDKSATPKGKGA